MLLRQSLHPTHAVRLRAVASPHVTAAPLRSSCIVHGKTTAAQLREREAIEASASTVDTPVVDYLLETSPYSKFLDEDAIASMRTRERFLSDAPTGEKLRRLRIGFANKGRKPWNVGKHHKPGTIERIRKGVAKAMKDPAVIAKLRQKYIPQTPEARAKITAKTRMRYGVQLHKTAFGSRLKNCNVVATTGVSVFHCHIGCSAMVGFRRVGWRRSVVFRKRSSKRSVRRKLTKEEKQASRARAAQRCAEIMKQKWQDPEYRTRQAQAIRASHQLNPRRPKKESVIPKPVKQTRSRQPTLLQKSLESDNKAFQAALQELQQTRAYCAKFEGVVSKLQAQADALQGQPEAQRQVQDALDGVLASRGTALDNISMLEQKVARLQAQFESTQAAQAKQERDAEQLLPAEASASPAELGTGPDLSDSRIDCQDAGGAVSTNRDGPSAGPSTDVAAASSSGPGAMTDAARGAGTATTASGINSRGDASHTPPASIAGQAARSSSDGLRSAATADESNSSTGNSRPVHGDAAASAARSGHSRQEDTTDAQRPLNPTRVDHNGSGAANGNGNAGGAPATDGPASYSGMSPDGRGGSGFGHHSVDLDSLRGVGHGGGAVSLPTAAEWKTKMLDTSQNGHVVTGALSAGLGVDSLDMAAEVDRAGGALLVQSPPETDGAGTQSAPDDVRTGDEHITTPPANGSDAHRHTIDAVEGELHDEEQDSLGWLKRREHKLPWQE